MRHLKKIEEESSKQRRQQVQRLRSGSILSFSQEHQGHQCGKARMSEGRVEDWDALDFVGLESVWKDTLLRKNN